MEKMDVYHIVERLCKDVGLDWDDYLDSKVNELYGQDVEEVEVEVYDPFKGLKTASFSRGDGGNLLSYAHLMDEINKICAEESYNCLLCFNRAEKPSQIYLFQTEAWGWIPLIYEGRFTEKEKGTLRIFFRAIKQKYPVLL